MKRAVYELTPVRPVPKESNQEIKSNFAIGSNPWPRARMTISELIPIDQLR